MRLQATLDKTWDVLPHPQRLSVMAITAAPSQARYPRIVQAVSKLRVQSLIMNGEAVCVDARGRADFDRLHSKCFNHEAVLVAFDLMELNGLDWAKQPLEKRKARLAKLLKTPSDITYNEHFEDDGEKIFKLACKLKLEGIVSKRRDLPYRGGPSKTWLKTKIRKARQCSG